MASLRDRAFAFVLAASLLLASAGTWLTAAPAAACMAGDHDCGQTSTITQCCCGGEQGSASSQNGFVVSRIEVSAGLTVVWVAPIQAIVDCVRHVSMPVHTSPTRGAPPDFPTLFASFLI